jgi:diguanylate cyclase (GGDEF)-like protein/PAS domain S-box-containing protein
MKGAAARAAATSHMKRSSQIASSILRHRKNLIEGALILALVLAGCAILELTLIGSPGSDSPIESKERILLGALIVGGIGFLIYRRIVVQQREAARLSSAEHSFRLLVEGITAYAIYMLDPHGVVSNWNSGAQRIKGYAADEIVGRHFSCFYTSEDRIAALPSRGLEVAAGLGRYEAEGWRVRKDGSHFWASVVIDAIRDEKGTLIGFAKVTRDITDRRRYDQRLHRLAHFDTLTELPGRHVLLTDLKEALQQDTPTTFLAIKLNGFKDINNTLGHSAGDAIMKTAGERIHVLLTGKGRAGSLSGDEFGVVAVNLWDPLKVAALSHQLIETLTSPFAWEDQQIYLNPSIGIAISPEHGTSAQELTANADLALYRTKAEGQSYSFFQPDMRQAAMRRRACERELRRAVAQGELELFYQPQVSLLDRRIVGAEALLRWRHPERGVLAPGAFLSVLESCPLAAIVGAWAIDKACKVAATARQTCPGFRVCVNLFGAQFRNGDLISTVEKALADHQLTADALELEITENIMLQYDDAMIPPLRELRSRGVGIAFDDYGTGYASLSLLKRYPLTRLKIDQSIVRNVIEDAEDAAVVQAVLYLGRSFEFDVIAEGVETEAHETRLREYGCKEAQGYFYGRPVPVEQMFAALSPRRPCLDLCVVTDEVINFVEATAPATNFKYKERL